MEFSEIQDQKRTLRTAMRSMVKDFMAREPEHARHLAELSADCLTDIPVYRSAGLVLAFVSLPQEIDTMPVLERVRADGKLLAVPRIIPDTDEMEFYYLDGTRPVTAQLAHGAFGIREPLPQLPAVGMTVSEPALMIMPGLAFTADGRRLGKGRGYYDRWLSRTAAAGGMLKLMGLCFPCQLVPHIPCAAHDVRAQYVLCGSSCMDCAGSGQRRESAE